MRHVCATIQDSIVLCGDHDWLDDEEILTWLIRGCTDPWMRHNLVLARETARQGCTIGRPRTKVLRDFAGDSGGTKIA